MSPGGLVLFTTTGGPPNSTGPTPEFTSINVNNNGSLASAKSASGSFVGTQWSGTWTPITGTPGNSFFVKVVPTSGAFTSGDLVNTVLALTVDRNWRITQTGSGTSSVTCNIQIFADAAGTSLLAQLTGLTVTATVP